MKKKMHFTFTLIFSFDSAIKSTPKGAANDALTNLYKDAQEVTLELALALRLWLYFLVHSIM